MFNYQSTVILNNDNNPVTVSHLTKCNTNSKVRAIYQPNKLSPPFLLAMFCLTQPYPYVEKGEYGRMQFNRNALENKERVSCHTQDKTDEFNVIPGHNYRIILTKGEPS